MGSNALIVLEDGTYFKGTPIGVKGIVAGQIIFNTAHVGYQETLTDPSYAAQIIVFTTPHIGNIGCNHEDEESSKVWASGLVLKEKPTKSFYWRSKYNLQEYLEINNVVGIAQIDTRQLTHLVRVRGNLSACIATEDCSIAEAKDIAKQYHEINSPQLLNKVSTVHPYVRQSNSVQLPIKKPHIVVYDFGVKNNILRQLEQFGCNITVVPALTPLGNLYKLNPDGIVLSNGPGNPLSYTKIIEKVKFLIKLQIPILGICLGHQLLGLALGAKIEKLQFGHHGINHPIKELFTEQVFVTSQNHNFCLSDKELPNEIRVTYRSLFDSSIQGIKHKYKPLFGIQGHPEGSPGPTDIGLIFREFIQEVFQYNKTLNYELNQCLKIPA